MHWDDLRIFLAVAREGSISGGANRLKVQHSTVSRRVKSLQAQLGTTLFERKKSGFELTQAGEELRDSAQRIEREVIGLEGALSNQDNFAGGELTVTAINNMASTILLPVFARFSMEQPETRLHIHVSNKYVSLAERQADVAIRLTNTPPETLVGTRLTTVTSAVYGSCNYLRSLAKGSKPRWLGIECCEYHRSWTSEACPDHDHNFYIDDTLLTLAALKQDLGLAYLPCFMGDGEESLQRYRPPDAAHDLGLWLLYHADLKQNKRVQLFRAHMIREIGNLRALFEGEQSVIP
ncbi:LysR family transcriptional regulator [Litchfieldella rifensis]|uniref:LysR family transcriptional regulator n=1 Tax=Litchfieldella rifensis TaxID=762643 RepID=A0ABV7LUW5_9GAMM